MKLSGSVRDSYSFGQHITDEDTQNIIAKQIDEKKIPLDKDAMYIVLTSQDVRHRYGNTRLCYDYCGYTSRSEVFHYRYALVGNRQDTKCKCGALSPSINGLPSLDAAANIVAHELWNVVTRPKARTQFVATENTTECIWQYNAIGKNSFGAPYTVESLGKKYLIRNFYDRRSGKCLDVTNPTSFMHPNIDQNAGIFSIYKHLAENETILPKNTPVYYLPGNPVSTKNITVNCRFYITYESLMSRCSLWQLV
jgi:hypothetical protein